MTTRVVIADDHPVFRHGLRAALQSATDIEVVGEAATGPEAVDAAMENAADVVLMDLNMPGGGLNATAALAASAPNARVLILTMFDNDESLFDAMRAGARGYIVKGADQVEIVRAIRAVATGEVVFGAGIAGHALAFFTSTSATGRGGRPFPELSNRELEVLRLIATGQSNGSIAQQLFLSEKTVRNHVSAILAKLRSPSRADAIVRAHRAGLGDERQPGGAAGPASPL